MDHVSEINYYYLFINIMFHSQTSMGNTSLELGSAKKKILQEIFLETFLLRKIFFQFEIICQLM